MFEAKLSRLFGRRNKTQEPRGERILAGLPDQEWLKLLNFDPRTQNPYDVIAEITTDLTSQGKPEPRRLDLRDMLDVMERRAEQLMSK